jgi:hypothetical protein
MRLAKGVSWGAWDEVIEFLVGTTNQLHAVIPAGSNN